MVNGELWRSRQGVGPIEMVLDMGTERGTKSMLATTASHFDDGFAHNGFAWVTCGWEMGLVEARKIYGYGGRNGMEGLHVWLTETRKRWPDAKLITQGEFGLLWRTHFQNNDKLDYQFVHRGAGIRASQENLEIRWFMNKDFRLAMLRDWKEDSSEKVIDFTRYDLPATEPADPTPGQESRNWSFMNRINQKGKRPQDVPVSLSELTIEDQALIRKHYPKLLPTVIKQRANANLATTLLATLSSPCQLLSCPCPLDASHALHTTSIRLCYSLFRDQPRSGCGHRSENHT